MTHPDYPLGIDCEEMLVEEYDSNESIVIYNSDDDFDLSDSELSNDFEIDTVLEDIFDTEEHYLDEEKIDGCYYIGLPCLMKSPREWILQISIQPKTMLSNRFSDVMRYLTDYSVTRIRNPRMHIMKLDVSNTGAYNVTLKTFWLKLVQRTWKRVFKERQDYINDCKKPHSLLYRGINGHWANRKGFPGLIGMFHKN
jgi:hypothetical protein